MSENSTIFSTIFCANNSKIFDLIIFQSLWFFRTKMRCLNQCDKISHFLTIFKSLNFLHFSTGCWHICQVVLTPVAMSVVYLPSNALALPTMTWFWETTLCSSRMVEWSISAWLRVQQHLEKKRFSYHLDASKWTCDPCDFQ